MRYMVITMRSLALSGLLLLFGCGGLSSRGTPTPPPNGTPQFGHVFLVVEENHSYSDVIGNSQMPYLNNLASQYGLATQYFANIHPSLGNYFMLTTGLDTPSDDLFNGTVSADNVVRELVKAGKSWKCYAENLPSVGYTGNDLVFYPYVKWHNPIAYFTVGVGAVFQQSIPPGRTIWSPSINSNPILQPAIYRIIPSSSLICWTTLTMAHWQWPTCG